MTKLNSDLKERNGQLEKNGQDPSGRIGLLEAKVAQDAQRIRKLEDDNSRLAARVATNNPQGAVPRKPANLVEAVPLGRKEEVSMLVPRAALPTYNPELKRPVSFPSVSSSLAKVPRLESGEMLPKRPAQTVAPPKRSGPNRGVDMYFVSGAKFFNQFSVRMGRDPYFGKLSLRYQDVRSQSKSDANVALVIAFVNEMHFEFDRELVKFLNRAHKKVFFLVFEANDAEMSQMDFGNATRLVIKGGVIASPDRDLQDLSEKLYQATEEAGPSQASASSVRSQLLATVSPSSVVLPKSPAKVTPASLPARPLQAAHRVDVFSVSGKALFTQFAAKLRGNEFFSKLALQPRDPNKRTTPDTKVALVVDVVNGPGFELDKKLIHYLDDAYDSVFYLVFDDVRNDPFMSDVRNVHTTDIAGEEIVETVAESALLAEQLFYASQETQQN